MRLYDNVQLTNADQPVEYDKVLKQSGVLVTVQYTKGDEADMELAIDASNRFDSDGGEVWAPLSRIVEDGGAPARLEAIPNIYTFSASGSYRFLVSKALREDKLRFRVKANGGTVLGTVTIDVDLENSFVHYT